MPRPDNDFYETDGYINRSYLGSGTASSNKFLRGDHVWETIPSGTAAGSYNILAAGTQTANSTGSVLFNNANGLTFGMSNSSVITASYTVPSTAGLLSAVNVSAGTTSNNLSALTFNNSNGISFGLSGSVITGTVQTNYLTTAMASNRGSDFVAATAAFAGTSASGTIASSGISVSIGPYITTAMASNRGTDFVQANAAFAGTSASGTIASNGISVSIGPYITTGALSNHSHGVSFTSGSVAFQTLSFTNSNGISFNSGTQGIFGSHNALTSQSNQNVTAGNGGFAFQTLSFSNVNGISFGTSAGSAITASHNALTTAAASDHSHGNPTLNLTNLSGTTASNSAGFTLSLSAAATGAGGGFAAQGSGAYTQNTGTIQFANSNGITFGLSTNQMTASHNGLTTAAASDHSHGNPQLNLTNLSGTTASNSAGFTLSLSAAAPGGAATKSYHRFPHMPINTVTVSFGQSTSFVAPFILSSPLSIGLIRMVYSGSVAASSTQATTGNTSLSMSGRTSHNIVFYSRGVGGNSMSLQYVTSTQQVDAQLVTISYAANSTQMSYSNRFTLGSQSFTKDYSSSAASQNFHTSNLTDLTGPKYIDLPMAVSLDAGQYWIAYGRSTTNATQANSISVATRMLVSHNTQIAVSFNTLALGMLGGATNSSVGWWQAHGSLTTAGGGTTSSIPMANVSTLASNNALYIQMMNVA